MKSKDLWLLINKTNMDEQTGVKRWNEVMPMEKKTLAGQSSAQLEQLAKRLNYENFSLSSQLHRIIVTKKELFRFGIKTDNECLYCELLW